MPAVLTRADSLREYLTGAASDGASQTNPQASLGGFRSSQEALSLGIVITNSLSNVSVLYANGANPVGAGTLTAVDANHLTWQPFGAPQAGPPAFFSGVNDTEIVEAYNAPGQYLRVQGTTPFSLGLSTVTLAYLADDVFSMDDVSIANALGGISEYRATIARNEANNAIQNFQRWISLLGTPQISNLNFLPLTGNGVLSTTGTFVDWPTTGYCQIQTSGGVLKELVYYSSRTLNSLTVPAFGRGLLGTSLALGTITDILNPVPGIALAVDPTGVQPFGSSIQSVVSTAPGGVTWSLGITAATGLQIGTLSTNQQVGIWEWRQIPAGTISTPQALIKLLDSFNAF